MTTLQFFSSTQRQYHFTVHNSAIDRYNTSTYTGTPTTPILRTRSSDPFRDSNTVYYVNCRIDGLGDVAPLRPTTHAPIDML